jgi:hypothetical protein
VQAATDTPMLHKALAVKELATRRLSAADARSLVMRGGYKEAAE